MAVVTAELVKRLRDLTGAGMMDCKKALEVSNGDIEEAVIWLREQGIAKAGKRAGRATANGVVEAYLHRTGDYPPQTGSMLELDCESDVAECPEPVVVRASAVVPDGDRALFGPALEGRRVDRIRN